MVKASQDLDRLLVLEMVRVTEAAAISETLTPLRAVAKRWLHGRWAHPVRGFSFTISCQI